MLKQSSKRLFSSILALVFIIGAVIVVIDYIKPAFDSAQVVKGEELSRRSFVENQLATIKQVTDLISAYQEQEQLQELVSLALPLEPNLAQALTQMNGLALSNGLTPQSFSITAPAAQTTADPRLVGRRQTSLIKPIGTLGFRVRLVGSYDNFKKFLKNVETNIRILDVKTVSFQPASKVNENLYAYDVVVDTYYQNP